MDQSERYYADRHDARRLFGRWLAHAGAELLPGIDIIVPVPLARGRLLRRQYNQAAVLAQELGRLSTVRFDPLILERTRATRAQVGLSHDERRRNVRGAFRVAPSRVGRIATRNLLLVDDVITTGATVGGVRSHPEGRRRRARGCAGPCARHRPAPDISMSRCAAPSTACRGAVLALHDRHARWFDALVLVNASSCPK